MRQNHIHSFSYYFLIIVLQLLEYERVTITKLCVDSHNTHFLDEKLSMNSARIFFVYQFLRDAVSDLDGSEDNFGFRMTSTDSTERDLCGNTTSEKIEFIS